MDQEKRSRLNRREFVGAAGAVGVAMFIPAARGVAAERPAILGGTPAQRGTFPDWPQVKESDIEAIRKVTSSGQWYRAVYVPQFEEEYARLNQAKYCVATASGTTALYCSLGALGIGPGDEVIVPPYTFMATVTVVLQHYALPVFVDSDRETFLMDPTKLEAAITDRTAAIIPVHIGGNVCDMDRILAIAQKHNIPVIGDACQAHLAEWRGRSVGSWGTTGCYSFQLSKNLCSGEGGAILTNDEEMADKCYAFHNCARKRNPASRFVYRLGRNTNARMTEFQAAILLSQMAGIKERADIRTANADYLTSMLREIPGIYPARMYEGCTRNAYHLYMFRFVSEEFGGLSRSQFLRALRAEGVPVAAGYSPLNKDQFLLDALNSRGYIRVYGKETIAAWPERNQCPENDKLCAEGIWMAQNVLLGSREQMEQIAKAVAKIRAHAGEIAKA
ncbi:MAG: DegT/DnrJ/EryC1/StrS family aminotransferase [Thermoguttaceae bacterium]|nr:DegT/DnrJ/EryC1/StrS family aminotransferase [Thermoguttaceae bacterium]MDW8078524.1 DegT/DnrJ/EryC1/StrS family aminotransferase [Thermoguttaceae bacterium]